MSAPTDNTFEVLRREEAAPDAPAMTEEDRAAQEVFVGPHKPARGDQAPPPPEPAYAPATPGRAPLADEGPRPLVVLASVTGEGAVPVVPDVERAPGDVTFAEAVKEHKDAAGEVAREMREESLPAYEAAKTGPTPAQAYGVGEPAGAGEAGARAREAHEAAKETARETAAHLKERAAEAGEQAKETAAHLRERAGEAASSAAESAAELGHEARERATQAAQAAREKGGEVVEAAREYAAAAQEKETPEESASLSLLEEAMALAEGTPVPIRNTAAPAAEPRAAAAPPAAAREPAPVSTTGASEELSCEEVEAAASRGGESLGEVMGETAAGEPNRQHAISVGHAGQRASEAAHDAASRAAGGLRETAARAEETGARLVEQVEDTAAGAARRTSEAGEPLLWRGYSLDALPSAKEHAPAELASRMEREEEESAKGPLEALASSIKGAADFVKEKVLHTGEKHPAQAPTSADPQCIVWLAAGETGRATWTTPVDSTPKEAVGAGDVARAPGEAASEAAGRAAGAAKEAVGAAKEQGAGVLHAVEEGASRAGHTVSDEAKHLVEGAKGEVLHEVEEKARWTVEHTKEELHHTARQWQEEMTPKTEEELRLSMGEIPSSTEEILARRSTAGVVEHGTQTRAVEPEGPVRAAPGADHAGSGAQVGRPFLSERAAEAKDKAGESFKEAVQGLAKDQWGDEGEVAA
eukprot:scaffold1.g5380.t1